MDHRLANILAPFLTRASLENPDIPLSTAITGLFGGATKSGVNVTAETAIGLPGLWRAVNLLSQTVASLPSGIFENLERGSRPRRDHPLWPLLHNKANMFQTSFQWRMLSIAHMMLWGDAISFIDRENARATELLPFHPRDVRVMLQDGKLWYNFVNEGVTVDQSNVVHFKGLGFDGIRGKSIVSIMRENLGLGIAQQEFGANFYKNGAKLDGVITQEGGMNEDGLKRLRSSWRKTFSGTGGERVAILDAGQAYQAIGVPPEDSQFIESRKFTVTDIARITSIPPPLLYDLERATFSNISELILSFAKFTINPLIVNMEMEQDDKLLFESEKGKLFTNYNLDGLLRGDTKQRGDFYKILIQFGIFTPNEVRDLENRNPLTGGDQLFMQGNLLPINGQPTNGKAKKKDLLEALKEIEKNGEN